MILEIDILLSKGTVTKGYRQTCGSKKDSTASDFKDFEKEIQKLINNGMYIKKEVQKVDNAYATISGGFWQEFRYTLIEKSLITPNVRMIIKEKYRLVKNRIPREVRTELNKAVKNGILGHFKKDGLCPECYYFISFENEARNAITNKAMESIENIAKVLV